MRQQCNNCDETSDVVGKLRGHIRTNHDVNINARIKRPGSDREKLCDCAASKDLKDNETCEI